MFDLFFAMMAVGLNGAGGAPSDSVETPVQPPAATAPVVTQTPTAPDAETVEIAPGTVTIGQGVVVEGAPAKPVQAEVFNMAVVPTGLTADPQVPTGTFTTATEVKPVLNATKGNWVAVREYGGQDLLYITHLWSWRCGLKAIAISINEEPMQNWPMPACHEPSATPNAILPADGQPYLTLKLGAVQSITLQIVYDDLTMDVAKFGRSGVLIP